MSSRQSDYSSGSIQTPDPETIQKGFDHRVEALTERQGFLHPALRELAQAETCLSIAGTQEPRLRPLVPNLVQQCAELGRAASPLMHEAAEVDPSVDCRVGDGSARQSVRCDALPAPPLRVSMSAQPSSVARSEFQAVSPLAHQLKDGGLPTSADTALRELLAQGLEIGETESNLSARKGEAQPLVERMLRSPEQENLHPGGLRFLNHLLYEA